MPRVRTQSIPEDLREVLSRATVTEEGLDLPRQLDPKDYAKIKKILNILGVTWHKGRKTHLWDTPEAKKAFEDWIASGATTVEDTKATLQQFDTPFSLAVEAIELLYPLHKNTVLEPSAGVGSLVKALLGYDKTLKITAVEVDSKRHEELVKVLPDAVCDDFMMWSKRFNGIKSFDHVLMNPPFAEHRFAEHCLAAIDLLKPNGSMVAIVPVSIEFSQHKTAKRLREVLGKGRTEFHSVPSKAFQSAGTTVSTVMFRYVKEE